MRLLKQLDFLYNRYVCTGCMLLYRKITKKKYRIRGIRGRQFYRDEDGNRLIAAAIEAGKPCMIGRYGTAELSAMIEAVSVKLGIRNEFREKKLAPLCNNAGFFPKSHEAGLKFGEKMLEWSDDVDMLAVWYTPMEVYAIKNYCRNAVILEPYSLEPYYYDEPWSATLAGKKVLVIHPFEETIRSQYEKRRELFKNNNVLPDFEMITLKAVQSIGGGSDEFSSWFEALESMENAISAIDFDVALIGCGAYGFALASYVKHLGKVAIHIGGATQLLFGIKGKRWTDHPEAYPLLHTLFNDYWVRPSESERPKAAGTVEKGCYW